MNILKALIFTAILIGLEALISIGLFQIINQLETESIFNNIFSHYLGAKEIAKVSAYLIIFLILFKRIFKIHIDFEKSKKIQPKSLMYLLLIAIGVELIKRPFFDFNRIWEYLNGIETQPFELPTYSNLTVLYLGISGLIIAPIIEELFFRKFLYAQVLNKHSATIASIVSSICFSLIHLPNYSNLLPTFIFGIIACLVYSKTKNILYPIILHFLTNLGWFLFITFGKSYGDWVYTPNFNWIYWLLFSLGVGLSYYGMKKLTVANIAYD